MPGRPAIVPVLEIANCPLDYLCVRISSLRFISKAEKEIGPYLLLFRPKNSSDGLDVNAKHERAGALDRMTLGCLGTSV